MKETKKQLLRDIGLGTQVDKIEKMQCPTCGVDIIPDNFRDSISLKEFMISGMCQACQDSVFGVPDDK